MPMAFHIELEAMKLLLAEQGQGHLYYYVK